LLLALVENNGQLVLKDTLIKRVWPDTFVNDENLTYNISVLRKALGDGLNGQEYIETIPRRGYRFIAPVKRVAGNGEPGLPSWGARGTENPPLAGNSSSALTGEQAPRESDLLTNAAGAGVEVRPSTEEQPQGTHQPGPGVGAHGHIPAEPGGDPTQVSTLGKAPTAQRFLHLLARRPPFTYAAVGLAFVAVLLSYWFVRPLPAPVFRGYEALTNDGKEKRGPLLTDGSKLYFEERVDDTWELAVMPVTGGNPSTYVLPSSDVVISDIAPDGSNLIGWEVPPGRVEGRLLVWPDATGPPELLGGLEGRMPSWSPDGKMIVYGDGVHSLFVAGRRGEKPRKVVSVEGTPEELRWSPDGKFLRFVEYDPKTEAMTLWEMSMPSGHPHLLLKGWEDKDVGDISSWTADGSSTFFISGHGGPHDFGIWARREDCNPLRWRCREPVRIANEFSNYSAPLPSRDGKRLFVLSGESRRELAKYDLRSATFVRCLPGVLAGETDFSPDGQWVAYARMPERTLWRSRLDGSYAIPLTAPGAEAYSPHWSPDGKQIAYMAVTRDGQHKIYKAYATLAAGGEPRQLVPGATEEGVPTWSQDAQRLAFGDVLHIQNASEMAIHLLGACRR
jgi:DNA-binding winged helix-turn-helix (wHTH) protein